MMKNLVVCLFVFVFLSNISLNAQELTLKKFVTKDSIHFKYYNSFPVPLQVHLSAKEKVKGTVDCSKGFIIPKNSFIRIDWQC